MRVLKITAEGLTTSFRYPYYLLGVQPTYEMPPPATLYGHVAGALGEWFDPAGVQFAARFSYLRKHADLETTYLLTPAGGKLKGYENENIPKTLEGEGNPLKREILFFPRLTLYLNRPEWETAFRHPRYAVCLGRSQDLLTYRRIEVVDLQPVSSAYLQDLLLPYDFVRFTAAGRSVLMPRWLDVHHRRQPTFSRYLILQRRLHTRDLILPPDAALPPLWADPSEPAIEGDPLGLVFHTWTEA
ncbi:MAG: CRISPR-associated protein Cas5 [Chloroflexota bacterium]